MGVEEYESNEQEGCFGCGWPLDELPETHPIEVWSRSESRRISGILLCEPCYHTSWAWAEGRPLDEQRLHINNMTNLILRKINEGDGGE